MKGGLAASIIAVEALLDLGKKLPVTLEISGTVDEDSGGYGGVHYLAERVWFSLPRVDHVIIPEPLNVDRVCIGHRGVWWAEIETHGRMAHGSLPFLGDCALRHMHAVVDRFERDLYPQLAARCTDKPVVPSGALNINSIHGGQLETQRYPAPVVADSCRMLIKESIEKESIESVNGEVRELLERVVEDRAGFRNTIRDIFEVRPTMTDRNGPGGAQHSRGDPPRLGVHLFTGNLTTRSTSIAWANCGTALPKAWAFSIWHTSRMSTW